MPYSDGVLEAPCAILTAEASHEDLLQMGLIYSTGIGVEEDLVAAHKWFNLAALKGNDDAKMYRKDLSGIMSSSEIAEAQKSAREWLSLMH
jgi:TPR repeat protein